MLPAFVNPQDPLAGHPRYASIRTLEACGRTLTQLALDRATGEKVAIRLTARGWDDAQTKYTLRELLIHSELSACRHPHIVELREVFATPSHLGAVLEHVDGENLQTFLANTGGRVSEALARFLFQQLVLALDFCHARGKVSRGVKLANTLLALQPGQLPLLKLADFGFSKDTAAHSAPASQVGTALFVPPEVMHNFSKAPYDGAKVDVWAAGIVLFMLLFGRHPCLRPEDAGLSEQQQMLALFQRTAAAQFCLLPAEAASISPGCADLLAVVLKTDPGQRATMAQVVAHPWFQTGLPEGAALMNATILAEAAARPLELAQPPEVLAALVRHAQKADPAAAMQYGFGGQQLQYQPAAAVSAPPGAGVGTALGAPPSSSFPPGGSSFPPGAAAGGPRVASASAAPGAPNGWGAPPPARALLHSTSSNDSHAEEAYKRQEAVLAAAGGGLHPAGGPHTPLNLATESMSSSAGSFVEQQRRLATAQVAAQRGPSVSSGPAGHHLPMQQQQQQLGGAFGAGVAGGGGFMDLLATIPSAGLEEVLLQQQQQQAWMPRDGPGVSAAATTTTSGGGGGAGATTTSSLSNSQQGGGSQVAAGLAHNLHALGLQEQQQQQHQRGNSLGGLTSADLEMLLPLIGQEGAAGGAAAAATNGGQQQPQQQQASAFAAAASQPGPAGGAGRAVAAEKQESFMQMIAQLDSLPVLPSANIDALLSPAANPLLNMPLPPAGYAVATTAAADQQQQQGAAAAADHDAAAADDGLPDDIAAFMVDDEDEAAVAEDAAGGARGGGGATRKRLLSRAGGGFSSCSLDLRQLSDLLMGGSSVALMEGSSWHKICKNVSFSRDRAASRATGGGDEAAAAGGGASGGASDARTPQ